MNSYIIDNNPSIISKLKINIAFKYIAFQNFIIFFLKRILFKAKSKEQVYKILIFRIGSLGDGICAIPSIMAIRNEYKSAKIDILTKTEYKGLVSIDMLIKEGVISNVINYTAEKPILLRNGVKENNYDLIIELPPNRINLLRIIRDMFFFRWTGINSGYGWQVSKTTLFKKEIEKYVYFPNEVERLAAILERNGIKVDIGQFQLNTTDVDEKFVKNLLLSLNLKQQNIITISVGGKGDFKHWPIEYFKELCKYFNSDFSIIVIGGKEDNDKAEYLSTINNVYNLCGKLTPMQSAICLRNSLCLVSNDTGPLHLAYAVGVKVFGIYTARDFRGSWYPSRLGTVLRKENIPCAACYGASCDNNICLQAIKPTDVISEVEKYLTNL